MNDVDGKIIIGTDVDLTGFERKIRNLERKAEKKKVDIQIRSANIKATERELESVKNQIKDIETEWEKNAEALEKYNELKFRIENDDPNLQIEDTIDYVAYQDMHLEKLQKQIDEGLWKLQNDQDKLNVKLAKQKQLLLDSKNAYTDINEQLDETKQELENYKVKQIIKGEEIENAEKISHEIAEVTRHMNEWEDGTYTLSNGVKLIDSNYQDTNQELKNINFNLENVGSKTTKIIKKIGNWALAVFGLRSAYMFVRSAINTITEQDEQLKADITFIKTALAYSIEPLVRGIVDLAKLLVQYLGYIVQAWSGRDIFAKSAKSLASANKSAKDLNKTLFGFDKINKLSGNKDSGSSGVSSSIKPLEEGEEPGWLRWIGDNGDRVKTILMSIATALIAVKLGADLLTASAVGFAVYGIVMSVIDLIELLKDPTWEKFGQFLIDIGIAIMAIAVIVGGLPAIIIGAVVLVVGLIIKYWDQCKDYILAGLMVFVDTFIGIIKGIYNVFKEIFVGVYTIFKDVIMAIISLFKGDFKSSITYLGKAIGNVFITIINTIIHAINTVISPIRALIVAVGKVTGKKWTMDNIKIPTIPRLERGGIVHNPGAGVMMGNYVAGEGRNPEAVIPLDDATLDKLGQAIARHSQINATIVNEMDGRVLSKNLARVNSENAFARNGGY